MGKKLARLLYTFVGKLWVIIIAVLAIYIIFEGIYVRDYIKGTHISIVKNKYLKTNDLESYIKLENSRLETQIALSKTTPEELFQRCWNEVKNEYTRASSSIITKDEDLAVYIQNRFVKYITGTEGNITDAAYNNNTKDNDFWKHTATVSSAIRFGNSTTLYYGKDSQGSLIKDQTMLSFFENNPQKIYLCGFNNGMLSTSQTIFSDIFINKNAIFKFMNNSISTCTPYQILYLKKKNDYELDDYSQDSTGSGHIVNETTIYNQILYTYEITFKNEDLWVH